MSVPKTDYYEIVAENETSTSTVALPPILIPPNSDVRAHTMIVYAAHWGQTTTIWGVDVFISQYVQNGVVHNGAFRFVSGHNITEIVFSAVASTARVVGTLLLEYF